MEISACLGRLVSASGLQATLFELKDKISRRSPKIDLTESPDTPLGEAPNPLVPERISSGSVAASARIRAGGPDLPPVKRRVTPEGLTRELSAAVGESLPTMGLSIYRLLLEVGLRIAGARGYAQGVSQVSFFVPAEVVAFELEIHRSTLYRHLPRLQELGLVDARAHRTTYNGQTVADGTVWSVKLNPKRGSSARVRFEDLKHKWRDLAHDIDEGRTAYNHMRQSNTQEQTQSAVQQILTWALPREDSETPLCMTVARAAGIGLETVLDVPFTSREDRAQTVDQAAKAVCSLLGDDSINFYRWLLWQLLRLHDRGQDHFPTVFEMLQRALVDRREGFADRAGALFVSRLKQWDVWELVCSMPPWSVASRPARMAQA